MGKMGEMDSAVTTDPLYLGAHPSYSTISD